MSHNFQKLESNISSLTNGIRPVVLFALGSYCPIHNFHLEMFQVAKEYLELNYPVKVVAGYLSPSQDCYVSAKLKKLNFKNISAFHRLAMIQACVKDSDWLDTDSWEISQEEFVDYPEVLAEIREKINRHFPEVEVYFLCGDDFAMSCDLMNFAKKPSEAVCCIQRTQANPLPSKETAEGILFYSIPNKQLEKTSLISSTKIRELLLSQSDTADIPDAALQYFRNNNLKLFQLTSSE